MDEKEKLRNALQLFYERKYKGTVEVKISTPLLHLFGIDISVEFNGYKMYYYFDIVDFYTIADLEKEIRTCCESIESSYERQIDADRNLIRE